MHMYGKVGCISFVVAFILQLFSTFHIAIYLSQTEINRRGKDIPIVELHYLTVISCVTLIVCCLISRKLCQEHIHQVSVVLRYCTV